MTRPVGKRGKLLRTNVHLSAVELTALRKLAKLQRVTVAELIRRAIDAFLATTR